MPRTAGEQFKQQLIALLASNTLMSKKRYRRELIALYERFIAAVEAESPLWPPSEQEHLIFALNTQKEMLAAMKRGDEVELDRLTEVCRSHGGVNFLTGQ